MDITGTGASESLNGTSGDDNIFGAGGNDTIHGNGGFDLIVGEAGSDVLFGDAGGDILYGGDDTVADTLNGGAGDDTMLGGPGADSLDGGDGNDALGIDGGNTALGGLGDDYLQLNESSGGAFGRTVIDGGAGFDIVDFQFYQFGADVWLDQSTATGIEIRNAELVLLNGGANTVHGGARDDGVQGSTGDDRIEGGAGADILSGHLGTNTVNGGEGNDLIFFEGGIDTIAGGAGIDTLDLSALDENATVSLAVTGAQFSEFGQMTLASIERLVGGDNRDQLTGNASANTLQGGGGDDTLGGSLGSDKLEGGEGFDLASFAGLTGAVIVDFAQARVTAGAGNVTNLLDIEKVVGGAGGDTFKSGVDDDAMDGGAGIDAVSYASAAAGVKVSLTVQGEQNTVAAGRDNLTNIEILVGSAFNDVLTSGRVASTVRGGAGDDKLMSANGSFEVHHELDGGGGIDTVSFADIDPAYRLTIDLAAGTATRDSGDTFTLASIERVIGSAGEDWFYASDNDDVMDAGGGPDNRVSYEFASAGVRVSLSLGSSQHTGGSGDDKLTGFNRIAGSDFNDTITGAASGVSEIRGEDGNDILVSVGNGWLSGGEGSDTIISGAGDDTMMGSIDGDEIDTLSYSTAKAAVTVSLSQGGGQQTGGGGADTFSGFENLTGSKLGDVLSGDDETGNVIAGLKGNDQIDGRDGDDVLNGGAGRDRLVGGMGADTLSGGKDNDVFVFLDTLESDDGDPDVITDLKAGDRIDLSAIDANADTAPNEAFIYVRNFTGRAGEVMVSYDAASDTTHILLDVWGFATASMDIVVEGDRHGFRDFVL